MLKEKSEKWVIFEPIKENNVFLGKQLKNY